MRTANNNKMMNYANRNNISNDTHNQRGQTSEYAMSIVDPFNHRAEIPDGNMTASILKSVSQTHNITVPNNSSGDMMLVWMPGEPSNYLTVYYRVGSKYYFHAVLPMDQDLGESFTWGRLVSAALGVKSSTTSGTSFNISGTINACLFEELPDLSTITYNTITSYCRDGVSVMANGTVTDGVISLYAPTGDQEYRIFEDIHNYKTQNRTELPMPTQFWARGPKPEVGPWTIGSTNFAQDVIPPNCYGQSYLHGRINLQWPSGPDLVTEVTVIILFEYEVVRDDWTTIDTVVKQYEFRQSVYVEGPNVRYCTLPFRTPTWGGFGPSLRAINIDVYNEQNSLSIRECDATLVTDVYYNELSHGPGTLMAIQGLTPNQIISISGHYNYEVVPNAKLSQNVQTYGPQLRYYNPIEMPLVQTYLSNPTSGFKFIWNPIEYSMFIRDLPKKDVVDLTEIAKASGFTDFMSSLWQFTKPILKYGAPILGGALAGPAGATLGTAFSSFLGDAAMHRPGSIYRGSAALLDEAVMARVAQHGIPYHVITYDHPLERRFIDFRSVQRKSIVSLVNLEFDTNTVVNSFPIAFKDGTVDESFIIRTQRPLNFTEQDVQVFECVFPNNGGFKFSYQGSDGEFTDELLDLLVYYHSRFGQPGYAYTLWTGRPFDGGSCGGALQATVTGLTLPLPTTGMFFEGIAYCPNLINQKAQIGDLVVIGEREDPTGGLPFASTFEQMSAMAMSILYATNALTISDIINAATSVAPVQAISVPLPQMMVFDPIELSNMMVKFLTSLNLSDDGYMEFDTALGEVYVHPEEVYRFWDTVEQTHPALAAKNMTTIKAIKNRLAELPTMIKKGLTGQIIKMLKASALTMLNFQSAKEKAPKNLYKEPWPTSFKRDQKKDEEYTYDEIIEMHDDIMRFPPMFRSTQSVSYSTLKTKFNQFRDLFNTKDKTSAKIPQLERVASSLLQTMHSLIVAYNSGVSKLASSKKNIEDQLAKRRRQFKEPEPTVQVVEPKSYYKAQRSNEKAETPKRTFKTTDTSSTSGYPSLKVSSYSPANDQTDYDQLYAVNYEQEFMKGLEEG